MIDEFYPTDKAVFLNMTAKFEFAAGLCRNIYFPTVNVVIDNSSVYTHKKRKKEKFAYKRSVGIILACSSSTKTEHVVTNIHTQ